MRAVVVYESMFGNTRRVAEAIACGVGERFDALVVPVAQARPEVIAGAGLLVVGGPTHMRSMSRQSSRRMAVQTAGKPAATVTLEPGAEGAGLREWFAGLGELEAGCAAFDTRLAGAPLFTGRASSRIHRLLRQHGARAVQPPRSFIVGKDSTIAPAELNRARQWGVELGRAVLAGMGG